MKIGELKKDERTDRLKFYLGTDPMDYIEVHYEHDRIRGHHLVVRGGNAISVQPEASNVVSITFLQAKVE